MEKFIRSDRVVLLFDNYDADSQKLHQSFRLSGYDYPAVVIEDDGFLPENVTSVYGYFLGDFKAEKTVPGIPRYFNQITVPDYWEISGTNQRGAVHDLCKERARIFYAKPVHKRLVKVVDWYDERGVVRSSDHYNCYGALYARTIFNQKGQKVNKSYFSADGKETIIENYVTGDIILNDGDVVRMFHTKTQFVLYFMEVAGFGGSRIFFNSLSTPFFVSRRMPVGEKGDILFWQEPARDDIPGNMRIILKDQSTRTSKIMVQRRRAYEKLIALGAREDMVRRMGFVYPFSKAYEGRAEALICTNSDRMEQCQKLVEELSGVHFHIAALTEMSTKLMRMDAYENVSLYPGVKMSVLDELFDQCDIYLDVNHENEIVSAVYQAFLHNQIIFAFEETIHNRDCVAQAHIYRSSDVNRMVSDILDVLNHRELAAEHLKLQHEAALTETKEAYQALAAQEMIHMAGQIE